MIESLKFMLIAIIPVIVGLIFTISSPLQVLSIWSSMIIVIAILITLLAYFLGFRSTLILRHSIGVIGFPQSGKTTIITAVFNELFKNRFSRYKFVLRGNTIDRVNEDISKLEVGGKLSPTTDQDLFAYRVDVNIPFLFLSNKYKVEIGDCPGEDSLQFIEKHGEWLHHTPFFKWVLEADVFIFIIDLSLHFSDIDYHAKIVKAIRTAWQYIHEYHIEGKKNIKKKPILFVFSKADLLVRFHFEESLQKNPEDIKTIGFGDRFPNKVEYRKEMIDSFEQDICQKYNDIISYLEKETRYFSIHFASYFASDQNGNKLGIDNILKNILPR